MVIAIELADFQNSRRGFLVLKDPIPASAIDSEISKKVETLHIILDGGGDKLKDGVKSYGFSYAGGKILSVVVHSDEPNPAAVLEVVTYGALSVPGARAEANLEQWNINVLPKSIIEVRQISSQCNTSRIDLWIVIQSAGIC